MSDITCVKVNGGALPTSTGNPGDLEYWNKSSGTVVFAFRQAFGGGGPVFGVIDNLTALAGGGQTGATPLSPGGQLTSRVTTVATTGNSVMLPQSLPGIELAVINAGANSMNVFPFLGDNINAIGANAALPVAAAAVTIFYCCTAGQWHSK